jgi:Zn finger protein HypA/HybF involved in hydrogenase expression
MTRRSVLSEISKVEEAIKRCSSVKECLQYLGLRLGGGSYKQFYEWCKRHGLTPPKISHSDRLKNLVNRRVTPLENILVVGSSYNRYQLKNRLIAAGLLDNKCSECGSLPEWNGKFLSLQLDHINGVFNDNRLENVRLLCPNCHSQTPTFAGKNKPHKPRQEFVTIVCTQCGTYISASSKSRTCRKCASLKNGLKRRKVERPPLEVLKTQIEAEGYAATGRYYGVADNTIRKWLKDGKLSEISKTTKTTNRNDGKIKGEGKKVPHLKARKVERPSKEDLQKLVWIKPTQQIAKDFGVSDKAVEKWCKAYGIEKPPRGYWAKKQYGKI